MAPLPEFEQLVALAKRDPEAFERFRQATCQQFIATTPHNHRHRLAAVQNRVEMALSRAKTPLAGLIKVSGMMHDSLYQLSSKWLEFDRELKHESNPASLNSTTGAAIISLHDWKEQQHKHAGPLH